MDNYELASRRLPLTRGSLPKQVVLSYVLDYVVIILLFILFAILDNFVEPFHQHFALQNYTLQYPYAEKERVPVPALYFCVIIAPTAIILLYALVIDSLYERRHAQEEGREQYGWMDRLWEANCGILGLLLASGTAFVITGVLKNATGKPRPDFISRCLPAVATFKDTLVTSPLGLSNITICTQTDAAIMKDAFRSFPSGHSSSSWAGLSYLSFYLAGKLHFLDRRGEVWKTFVILTPTLGAALIAVSRIEDARHHPFDVVVGSILGLLCAFVAYRQYFPPISEPHHRGRPYSTRTALAPQRRGNVAFTGVEPVRSSHKRVISSPIHSRSSIHPDFAFPNPVHQTKSTAHATSPGYGPGYSRDIEAHPPNVNLFRQQVADSERLRHSEFPGAPGEDGPSAPVELTTYRSSSIGREGSERLEEEDDWMHRGRDVEGEGRRLVHPTFRENSERG